MEEELSEQEKNLLYISNEDINDVIKIIKSLEDLNVLIDGIIETVKYKKKGDKFFPALLAPLATSRAQPVISK